ncbi:rRNA methyltransferase Tgs1 [Schizosaccharomyces osmophilus]|uniref:Trimethylguanosine synthase n=1 Tax=Schizosaccharomyces osmophilus TaxID=2545709 RepID=A0AAE9WC51_9SCHI|nr:rRNA methyltransferase Tgs1 [Schizosaccharomyces osmophilus]WBW72894.1 rRNA methyltransferase Tgs1 [Schizosaccharomyces osmophilus]
MSEIENFGDYETIEKHIIRPPIPNALKKYWNNRYNLFSRFDEGIWLDYQSWYSVTPERVAYSIAQSIFESHKPELVIDAFSGCGGNTIQFAKFCPVISIELDPIKIAMAKHNLAIYEIPSSRVTFIQGDVLDVLRSIDFASQYRTIIFMSPPWGGPSYSGKSTYSLNDLIPYTFDILYKEAFRITPYIAAFLPKNTDIDELAQYSTDKNRIVVTNFLYEGYSKAICCYFNMKNVLASTALQQV